MSGRLIKAQIIEARTMAGELQIELTWQKPVVAKMDFGALSRGFQPNGRLEVPMATFTELRPYATEGAAAIALERLRKEVRPCLSQ